MQYRDVTCRAMQKRGKKTERGKKETPTESEIQYMCVSFIAERNCNFNIAKFISSYANKYISVAKLNRVYVYQCPRVLNTSVDSRPPVEN